MDITGIAKSHHVGIPNTQRHHPKRNGSCPIPSGRRQQDAAQGVYMGNKFLALRKSEVAKVAPDRAGIPADQ